MTNWIITHKNCPDGWVSYMIARPTIAECFGGFTHHPMSYGAPLPPIVEGDDVMFIDFCPTGPELVSLMGKAGFLNILDHHKSAIDYCAEAGITVYATVDECLDVDVLERPAHFAVLDMDHSGAGLARQWFGLDEDSPEWQVLRHVEDRDLWRFALPGTRDIFAALTSNPYRVGDWAAAIADGPEALKELGASINKYRDRLIDAAVDGHFMVNVPHVAGGFVPIANCIYEIGSDVAERLAEREEHGVGAYCIPTESGMKLGFRARGDGPVDVAKLAALLQPGRGGGHAAASGCMVSYEEFASWV